MWRLIPLVALLSASCDGKPTPTADEQLAEARGHFAKMYRQLADDAPECERKPPKGAVLAPSYALKAAAGDALDGKLPELLDTKYAPRDITSRDFEQLMAYNSSTPSRVKAAQKLAKAPMTVVLVPIESPKVPEPRMSPPSAQPADTASNESAVARGRSENRMPRG